MTSSVHLLRAKTKLSHCQYTHPSCWSDGCCQVVKLCAVCADVYAFGTPAAGVSPGYGHMLISTHGGGHMPTGMSPGYVMTTPDFCLPVLTPLLSPLHPQKRQRFVPDPDSAVAQPASSPRAASPATAGASLVPMPLLQATAEAPAVSSPTSIAAAGSPADPIAAATASTAVTSVEAAEISKAPAQTPAGAIAASSAAAGLMPASAAPAKTVAHGPLTDLPLFCGAQKRAAFAFAQQVHTLKLSHQLIFA